jgi:glycine/D-amino acid oxidase-like deaminating enzyme
MTAALTLARAGRSVVVFDAMRAGEGASSRNGGICSGNIKFSFSALIDKFGVDQAKSIFAEGIAARTALIKLIEEENLDCGFKMVGRFDGANHVRDYDSMGRETDLLNRHLDFGAFMVTQNDQREELGTDFYKGGRVRPDIGGVHPAELHQGIYERALSASVTVIDQTAVTGISRSADGFTLNTARGSVKAGECIVATNGYTDKVTDWLKRRIIPIPSQIIATDTLDPDLMDRLMPKRRMVGDTRNLYNYCGSFLADDAVQIRTTTCRNACTCIIIFWRFSRNSRASGLPIPGGGIRVIPLISPRILSFMTVFTTRPASVVPA